MNNENIIIEKLNDIKTNQIEMKNDLNKKIDHLDKNQVKLKNDLNKRIDHVEVNLTNIKDNHLHSIYDKLAELKHDQDVQSAEIIRDNQWLKALMIAILTALICLLLKQIFFP